jgi:hypothetical protein
MKWKEIILGALITLIITIVAGMIVWNLTKEPTKPEPMAKVVFESDSPAQFKSKSKNLIFNTVRIGNLGNKTAHKTTISIEYPEKTNILDFTISNSSGKAAIGNNKVLESNKNEKLIFIESLMPDEVVTIAMLTDGNKNDNLIISARYENGVGEKGILAKGFYLEPERNKYKSISGLFITLLLGVFITFMLYRLRQRMGGSRSVNNSAFMMLHQGLIDEATKMLESEFHSKGGTAFEMANLGLCKGLSGDLDAAEKLFKSAELYSNAKPIKVLVEFNRSLTYFKSDDLDKAKLHFSNAIKTNKRLVKWYVKLSEHGQALVNNLDEFKEFSPISS